MRVKEGAQRRVEAKRPDREVDLRAGKPQASTSTAGGRRIWSSAPHGGSGLSDAPCLAVIPALPGDLLCAGVCPVRDFYSGVCKPRNCMNTLYLPYGEGILPSPQDP